MSAEIKERTSATQPPAGAIEMPAPTAWPIVLAFGVTLLFAGMVTSGAVSFLGAVLMLAGSVGWFREVLPHQKHESVPVSKEIVAVTTRRPKVARIAMVTTELHRARLPLEIYPISAGVKGGLAGSVAMAVLAVIYGIVSGRGMWYAINLLSIGFFPERDTIAAIGSFHWDGLVIGSIVHLLCSVLVGLLYGATLPMFPRRPILLGGVIAPVLWSTVFYSILQALDPVLNKRIDWLWFAISQVGFGLVAGIVVSTQERIRTWQFLPFEIRAGIEGQGTPGDDENKQP